MSKNSVYFVSLGCDKNLVDSQVMLGKLDQHSFKITEDPNDASIIIINTCSFIEAAKKESIDTILEFIEMKKDKCELLVVAGCMAQRYPEELENKIPEIDLIIGTGEYYKIADLLEQKRAGKLIEKKYVSDPRFIHTELDPRINTSPTHLAWLKISEGCNRNCTFCIIPTLRGKLRSRKVESLVKEAQLLADKGVKEIGLISQDLSQYGSDLDNTNTIYKLLEALETVEGIEWIRLFYFYPDELTDEVIDLMAKSQKISKYIDMPVQHFSNNVLKRMNRKITSEVIHNRIEKLRELIPGIVIRTSIIVGFPGETEADFNQLLEGVSKAKFDRLGIFRYSNEEGTPAYNLLPKVDQQTIDDRFDTLFELQENLIKEKQQSFIGKKLKVLVEGHHEETDLLIIGRHQGQAPEVDGNVIINDTNDSVLVVGEFVNVEITEVNEFDLIGRVCD